MRRHLATVLTGALATAVLVAGCSSDDAGSGTASTPGSPSAAAAEVTVYAAASLQSTFTELATIFEADHPGTTVTFNFAGSQTLAEQITQGAPADVLAAANESTMNTVSDAGLTATDPAIFATNQLMIAVPPDNPAGITGFADLAQEGLALVVCAPEVPCGAATEKVEQATGITVSPVSEEQSVTDVLAKVQAGEADAGLVYRTDVIAAGDTVTGIDFPESAEAVNRNPIAALKDGPQAALGQEFVDLVLSQQGQQVLADAGFGSAD